MMEKEIPSDKAPIDNSPPLPSGMTLSDYTDFNDLKEFITAHSDSHIFQHNIIELTSANYSFCPPIGLWKIPVAVYEGLGQVVKTLLTQQLEAYWPSLKILMGTNLRNFQWTSRVAMFLAFTDIARNIDKILNPPQQPVIPMKEPVVDNNDARPESENNNQ